jgi:predicted nucleotidyltransferase
MNLEELVGRLKLCCRDLEEALEEEFMGLVLFGSWARGDFGEGSDVDLLVVLKSLKGMEVRSAIYRIIAKHVGRAVTLIDMCAEDLFKDSLELTPLLLNILMDGVVIYDRMGRIGRLIAKAGELVEKAGLVRYKTPDGKYGWRRLDGKPLTRVEV